MNANYSNAAIARSNSIIEQAFGWMFGGLMVTAVTAMAAASDMGFQQTLHENPLLFWGLILAELGLVVLISAGIQRMSRAAAVGAFLLYAGLTGVTISTIFLIYTATAIYGAFLATGLIFGVMALYGYATKTDLTSIGNLGFMLVLGLIIAWVVNMFLHSGPLAMLISFATVVIFCGLTAYDTQKLKVLSTQMEGGNLGIYGALSLYIDFINIFLALLRIFGGSRNN